MSVPFPRFSLFTQKDLFDFLRKSRYLSHMPEGSHRFQVGSIACTVLSDGYYSYPTSWFFPNADPAHLTSALASHHLPPDAILSPYTCLLIETGRHTVLVDTGINYMFLSPPEGTRLERGRRAPEGSGITVFMPDQRNPQPAYYGFTVGARGNPMHPERVEVVHDRGVFVNTGRMFLEGFDYLYDAAGGYVGFGWNGRLSSGYGGVTPGLSYAP